MKLLKSKAKLNLSHCFLNALCLNQSAFNYFSLYTCMLEIENRKQPDKYLPLAPLEVDQGPLICWRLNTNDIRTLAHM